MIHATAGLFEALCGQHITVKTASGTESWRVVSVTRHQAHALRSDQPFSAYLMAPVGNDRQQGMRASTLPNGEPFEFFAVPVTATSDGVSYELVLTSEARQPPRQAALSPCRDRRRAFRSRESPAVRTGDARG